ncbi:MAG: SPFH domain-containing protein [Bacteroidales bacterium]|nr:SPFH domain-containing protein [Bacteroidales bacterium]
MMDVIRCDLPEYLVWKWSPNGNNSDRQNSIRWGSSLSVKDGEVAVFVYNQKGKPLYDYITGPYDQILKTDNFPVLATIIGWAYGGKSPFQAEVYFINLSGNNQIRFGIPYFDIFDSRFPEIGVPVAVRGTLTFNITDYIEFTKLNRLINFDLDDFQRQIKSMFVKAVKSVILQIPDEMKIPVVSIERKIEEINSRIQSILDKRLYNDFGVNLKVLDIEAIEINKASLGYRQLMSLTADITTNTYTTQANLNIQWMQEKQRLELENLENNLRIQREEAQRAQRLQTESKFINAHQIDMQAETLNNSFSQPQFQQVPPTMPSTQYYVGINGQSMGPFSYSQIQQFIMTGEVTQESLVWKTGLINWTQITQVTELSKLFADTPPPFPM